MKNLSLYDITNGFTQLILADEISEEEKQKINEELTLLLKQKSENIIGFTKNIELTIDSIKNEEKRLAENRKNLENKLANFKDYVKKCMENAGLQKVDTVLGTISIAKNPISVEITDENEIPNKYKVQEITTKIDKKSILNDFKETGEVVEGTKIITDKTNLRMK